MYKSAEGAAATPCLCLGTLMAPNNLNTRVFLNWCMTFCANKQRMCRWNDVKIMSKVAFYGQRKMQCFRNDSVKFMRLKVFYNFLLFAGDK